MDIKHLIELFGKNPHVQEVRKALDMDLHAVQVEGLAVAAKGLFIAALRNLEVRPFLIITYNYEQAERLYDDILSLGIEGMEARIVPPGDGMIYQGDSADLDTIGRRISALTFLQSGEPGIVIAPIASVLQKTIPPSVLAANRVVIEKSGPLDMDECCRGLLALGYNRVEMIERQGEFSRRGGILDVFPSTDFAPIRVELWGDDVESIRRFDVETQRSSEILTHTDIFPAREMLLDESAADRAADSLDKLLTRIASGAFDRNETDQIDPTDRMMLAHAQIPDLLRSRVPFDGMEYYLPLAYPEEHTLLDYLPPTAVVIMDEPHQVESHWRQLHEELLESLAARVKRGEAIPLPMDHVISFEHAAHILKRRRRNVALSLLPRPSGWMEIDLDVSLSASPMDSFSGQIPLLVEQLKTWVANAARVIIISNQPHRVIELLGENELPISPLEELSTTGKPGIYVMSGMLRSGFKLPDARLMVVTDAEMFGLHKLTRARKTFKKGTAISSLLEISDGDFVVHINHGIGRYRGLTRLPGTGEKDYLVVEYQGTDKLYVPVDQIDRIQKYIGADAVEPALNKMGGVEWAKTTKRVKAAVQEMAKDLIKLYAARQSQEGHAFSPDTPWQQEMESAFQYEPTQDQMDAIREVKEDLEAYKPMDRLICGDVGYGKTEVAMRAVFKVVNDSKQVAVLAPTTVLAQQHYNTFVERFAAYPVKVGMLSRFKTRAEQKKIIEGLRTGEVDIVIGTHRLLSKDIQFRDLGMLVVDEEQRFGVAHKERLKQLKKSVDVLTLSATPIPRTLHMALSGIRDMSLINEAPEGRAPIKTYCREYEDEIVRDAILREIDRDGQVYFVHNRVEKIEQTAEHIRRLVPYARVGVGHGQMHEDELEEVMIELYEHNLDVFVCTTIIESGLDVPNVNTIIVNHADKMGLAQLYQLRGRVGRSSRQAYAYLLYEPNRIMTEVAEKRLQAIKEFTDLGSGFKIALRDLEIRGAGNLLGAEQHGQMASVGFDMYCQLLSQAVQELRGEDTETFEMPSADLPVDAHIPTAFIKSESQRLSLYKKMTAVRDQADIDKIEEELVDRFGKIPKSVANSLEVLRIRLKAAGAGVEAIKSDARQVTIRLATGIRLAPDVAYALRRKFQGTVFAADKIAVDPRSPRLLKLIGQILDDLPEALESSKAVYLAMV